MKRYHEQKITQLVVKRTLRKPASKLRQVFRFFIMQNRQPTGRAKKRFQWVLPSNWLKWESSQQCQTQDPMKSENSVQGAFRRVVNWAKAKKIVSEDAKVPSGKTLRTWLQKDFIDTKMGHHQTDYCDFCDKLDNQMNKLKVKIGWHKVWCNFPKLLMCAEERTECEQVCQEVELIATTEEGSPGGSMSSCKAA